LTPLGGQSKRFVHFLRKTRNEMLGRLKGLEKILMNNTVLEHWFSPMTQALENVRNPKNKFSVLSMPTFLLVSCIRQLNNTGTLRDHLQNLKHMEDEDVEHVPVARSTFSDALSNKTRLSITEHACKALYQAAKKQLPDRLKTLKGIGDRDVYAMDGSYQPESCHFYKITPSQGGTDSSKGHLKLNVFDLRSGLPVDMDIDISSISEIRFVKERWKNSDLTTQKSSLWVVDRGFIDANYWDLRKQKHGVTTITRMKSNLNYTVSESVKVTSSNKKQGVKKDQLIHLDSSGEPWRLIRYKSYTGETYEYLTNDLTLNAGVIAFLYHRRWDEEKYFDNHKNDMANAKAWGKNETAIKQQAIIGMITFILTRLFSHKQAEKFGMPTDGTTQEKRHLKKQEDYVNGSLKDQFRAFHTNLSKITKQVWRFLKGCMLKKNRQKLYENHLKPMMTSYL
jgi:hypothetical protein